MKVSLSRALPLIGAASAARNSRRFHKFHRIGIAVPGSSKAGPALSWPRRILIADPAYNVMVHLSIEIDREDDGRWIAEALDSPAS